MLCWTNIFKDSIFTVQMEKTIKRSIKFLWNDIFQFVKYRRQKRGTLKANFNIFTTI